MIWSQWFRKCEWNVFPLNLSLSMSIWMKFRRFHKSLRAFQIHFGWFLESFVQVKRLSKLFLVLDQFLAIFVDYRQVLVCRSQLSPILSTDWRVSFSFQTLLRFWSNFRQINKFYLVSNKVQKGFVNFFVLFPVKRSVQFQTNCEKLRSSFKQPPMLYVSCITRRPYFSH